MDFRRFVFYAMLVILNNHEWAGAAGRARARFCDQTVANGDYTLACASQFYGTGRHLVIK
jgi:hypothetical protein